MSESPAGAHGLLQRYLDRTGGKDREHGEPGSRGELVERPPEGIARHL